MKAKIISNLTGSISDGNHFEPHGTLQHVAHIPTPGVICQLKLGAAGLQYARAGVPMHVIPREQLIALFEKFEPKFAESPNGNTMPKDVDSAGSPLTGGNSPSERGPG